MKLSWWKNLASEHTQFVKICDKVIVLSEAYFHLKMSGEVNRQFAGTGL